VPKLSVTIITRNEAANIASALASTAWADEIVVVDCGSTDETVAIARQHGARVLHRDWTGYVDQKNFAAAQANHDWVLSVDADERVTPALAAEIRQVLSADPPRAGYRVPRVSWYLGRWVRATDWYPDYQLRLYDRTRGRWTPRRVHESVMLAGEPGRLRHELEHRPYRNISHHLQTMNQYTSLAAIDLYEQGRRTGMAGLCFHPPAALLRNYLLRGGFRLGAPGLVISLLNAYYVLLKFLKLWELQRQGSGFRAQGSGTVLVPGGAKPPREGSTEP
jgi:glycosyltransferase involved in cell wall biosynthesis